MTPETFRDLLIIKRVEHVSSRLANGDSADKIKRELAISRYELSHLRRLDKRLTDKVKALIDKNRLSEGHARALARLSGKEQENLLRDVLQKRWSVRILEQAVRAHLDGTKFIDLSENAKYYEQLSSYISDQLGHPVKIQPAKEPGAGEITITYYDLDGFDGIINRMRIRLPDNL